MYANPPKRPTAIRATFLNVESLSSDLELTTIVIVSSLLSVFTTFSEFAGSNIATLKE